MSSSLFADIKARKLAAKQQPVDDPLNNPEDKNANPVLVALLNDLRADLDQARSIESVSVREEFKAERLEHYKSWVEGILANDDQPYDKITTEMALWAIDGGDINFAIEIACYLITNGYDLPPLFGDKKTPTALLEQFNNKAKGLNNVVTLTHLEFLERLFKEQDVKDDARAWLYRNIGERYKDDDPVIAIEYFNKALALNSGIGVKTERDRLQKVIEKQTEQPKG